jgi:hypothetical protein
LLLGSVSLGACSEPLVERQDIADLRVLGARVEPHAEPSRASLLPGEPARVRWLVAGPRGPLEVRYGLEACASAESSRGIPTCVDEPFASVAPETPSHEPSLDLVVPEGARLLTSGVFCTAGDVRLEGEVEGSSCVASDADQELASYEVTIAASDTNARELNHHPDLADAELLLDGKPWLVAPAAGSGGAAGAAGAATDDSFADPCDADDAPRVTAGRTVTLRLTLSETAREARAQNQAFGALETLQISHLSTVGELERPFTVLEPSDSELTAELTWKAPKSGGPAHFYIVVRDLRGGVSWLERSVCVND